LFAAYLQLLFELCRFRNRHPAFDGVFELLDTLTHVKDAVVIAEHSMPTDEPAAQQGELARAGGRPAEADGGCDACGVSSSVDSNVDWCGAAACPQQPVGACALHDALRGRVFWRHACARSTAARLLISARAGTSRAW
jgi:hypothetical protein